MRRELASVTEGLWTLLCNSPLSDKPHHSLDSGNVTSGDQSRLEDTGKRKVRMCNFGRGLKRPQPSLPQQKPNN